MTLTLVEEICGFDLHLDEGRLDLQDCGDNGSSSSHLPSVSACNLKAVGSVVSSAFGWGSALTPDPVRDPAVFITSVWQEGGGTKCRLIFAK